MVQTASSEIVTVERKALGHIKEDIDLAYKRLKEVDRQLKTDELDSTCKCLVRGCLPDLGIAQYEVAAIKEMMRVLHAIVCDFLRADTEGSANHDTDSD